MDQQTQLLVAEYDDGVVSLKSFGNAVRYDPGNSDLSDATNQIRRIAQVHGFQDVLWQRLPSIYHPDRRFHVLVRDRGSFCDNTVQLNNHRYDGVILTQPGQSVAFTTRDCPTLVLTAGPGSFVAVLHCGRDALQGFNLEPKSENSVIVNALRILDSLGYEQHKLRGFVTMGIAAKHFPNDRYPEILAGVRELWGYGVVTGEHGCNIDLLALIRAQLGRAHVLPNQIEWDGLDTYSNPHLASMRAGHNGYHNLVLATFL